MTDDQVLLIAKATIISGDHSSTKRSRDDTLFRWRAVAGAVVAGHGAIMSVYFTSLRSDPFLAALIPTIAMLMILVSLFVTELFIKDRQHILKQGRDAEVRMELLVGERTSSYFSELKPSLGFWGFTDLHAYQLAIAIAWLVVFDQNILL